MTSPKTSEQLNKKARIRTYEKVYVVVVVVVVVFILFKARTMSKSDVGKYFEPPDPSPPPM